MKLRLRTKAIVTFVALVAYVTSVGITLTRERQKLLRLTEDLEQVYRKEQALSKVGSSVAHAILRLQNMLYAAKLETSSIEDAALDVELIQSSLDALARFDPRLNTEIMRLEQDLNALRTTPSLSGLLGLREGALHLDAQVYGLVREVDRQREGLRTNYNQVNDRMTVIALTMNILGAIIFGTVITLFFNRMARDIGKLEQRAMNVANGYQGAPLEVGRNDEVGGLMHAVNRMQQELRHREQQLEVLREQQFHREKMAAIGSLAAAVAHEINNPIAAIAGIAQSLRDSEKSGVRCTELGSAVSESILENTRRIASISRQIAELTAPASPEPGLLDLNGLARQTCAFAKYDKRLRGVDVVLDLDASLPAVFAVSDHLTQIMLNLLINAGDALEGVVSRQPTIQMATRATNDEIILTVRDNGCGMDAAVQARAFDESFTTKPPGKGRGLGLFLCKALLESNGGDIRLESSVDVGTTMTIRIPLQRLAA